MKDQYVLKVISPKDQGAPRLHSILKNGDIFCHSDEISTNGILPFIHDAIIPAPKLMELMGKRVRIELHDQTLGRLLFYEKVSIAKAKNYMKFTMDRYPKWFHQWAYMLFGIDRVAHMNIKTWNFISFMKAGRINKPITKEDRLSKTLLFGFHFEWNWSSRKKDPSNKIYWIPRLVISKGGYFWSFAILGIQFGMMFGLEMFNVICDKSASYALKQTIKTGDAIVNNNDFAKHVQLECERQWNENQKELYGEWSIQSDDTKAEYYNDMYSNLSGNKVSTEQEM